MTAAEGHHDNALPHRIRIHEALVAAIERRQEVLDLVCAAADPFVARQELRELLNIEDEGAAAVLDLQVRNFTVEFRSRITDRLAELHAQAGE